MTLPKHDDEFVEEMFENEWIYHDMTVPEREVYRWIIMEMMSSARQMASYVEKEEDISELKLHHPEVIPNLQSACETLRVLEYIVRSRKRKAGDSEGADE